MFLKLVEIDEFDHESLVLVNLDRVSGIRPLINAKKVAVGSVLATDQGQITVTQTVEDLANCLDEIEQLETPTVFDVPEGEDEEESD